MPKRKREADTIENGQNESSSDQGQKGNRLVEVLPGITRKITACAACRKNKIRCDMSEDGPPCVRCRRRGLSCVLNRSLQSLIDDTKNVQLLQTDVSRLHRTLDTLCQHLGLEGPRALVSTSSDRDGSPSCPLPEPEREGRQEDEEGCEVSPPESPSAVQAPIDTFLDITKIRSPHSIESPPSARASRSGARSDLISKGIITATVAERLVHHYFSRLDHYLYGIGGEFQGLEQLRASPILLAAICTVSALHDPQDRAVYETCNREFRSLVAKSTFEKRDVEYIRALCISSFWLADASRILCSDAIRRAADIRLHRSFDALFDDKTGMRPVSGHSVPSPSLQSPASATDRVRLWYLLFVCDQHLSILHNRDSLLRSDKGIAVGWESYLHRAETTESDVRILSQVSLLLIMGQVRDVLGSDNQTPLPPALASQILNYSRQLDKWYTKFSGLFVTNAFIGEFPKRGLQLHYQFGKLYLGHQVFKGLHGRPIPPHLLTAAAMAHDTAAAIFEMILGECELQEGLVGMPHYFHVMIAFAGHLLLEICQNYHEQLAIKVQDDFQLIDGALNLFRSTHCIPQHPIWRMTPGLNRKLHDCASSIGVAVPSATATGLIRRESYVQSAMPNQQDALYYPPVPGVEQHTQPLDDLLFTDFGEFSFPDLTSNFVT
ncbi:uncharacterized protein DSM5745_00028 [Aspergillus mulundensis]|uniref:Zn(2)-C6 fungal-type domain-containing protein n=1 Tax=Aspergillus mulundensis TaxID=1810919 RepID=A0A3D8T2B7_9EURO|nr:Uncharacterized protein DSM5745_00028 [Aspergillus mulundensis]RDW92706.1 Uncharacterized protein DSM5745_00028 [Aspergillus mulundensis]